MNLKATIKKITKPAEKQALFGLRRVCETGSGLELQYLSGMARVEVLRPGALCIRMTRGQVWPDRLSDAVVAQPEGKFQIETGPERIAIATDRLKLVIPEGPFRFEIYDSAEKLLTRDFPGLGPGFDPDGFSINRYIFPDEEFLGLGDKYGGLSRRGKAWRFWNTDVGWRRFAQDPRYTSIPFLISLRPGAVCGWFADLPGFLEMDAGKKYSGLLSISGVGDIADLYFVHAPSLKELVSLYTELTGRPAMPPLWALGFHQSRYSYFSAQEVMQVVEEFRSRRLPLSAIHLDIHYMDGYKPFTVNQKRFPDLAGLAARLKEQGVSLVGIIDPGLKADEDYAPYCEAHEKGYLAAGEDGKEYQRKLWPGKSAFPDFFREEVRKFWADQHQGLFEQGLSGIWNDMNEPSFWRHDLRIGKLVISFGGEREPELVHQIGGRKVSHLECRNLYGQKECEATLAAFQKFRPGLRPFLLSRSGFAGIQRLAAIWTGDNQSRFAHLAASVSQILSLSLSGVAFAGADIGGFARNCSPELFARWIQLGAFYPFCRDHSAIRTRRQEPYQFGPEVEDIARKYLQLRYRLLPTIYSLFRESFLTGIPLWRPLLLEFPNDFAAGKIEDQFMFGESLMIAPVLQRKAKARRVYLPEGRWTDFWDGREFSGSGFIEVKTGLSDLPIFVREGSILALQKKPEAKIPWPELKLEIYPARSAGRFSLYEDDGESEDYLNGKFSLREFAIEPNSNGYSFSIGPKSGNFSIPSRPVLARFHSLKSKPQIQIDGRRQEGFNWISEKNLLELEMIMDDQLHRVELLGRFSAE